MKETTTSRAPPRISHQDYEIRSKALELLTRNSPEHEIVFEYCHGGDDSSVHNNSIDPSSLFIFEPPISYQKLEKARVIERDPSPSWMTAFMLPLVSCVSTACRAGISGIAQQQTRLKRRGGDLLLLLEPTTTKRKYPTSENHSKKSHCNNNNKEPAVQHDPAKEVIPEKQKKSFVGQNHENFTDPHEYEPLGFLFIPNTTTHKNDDGTDETMSEMTTLDHYKNDDHEDDDACTFGTCPGFSLFGIAI